MLPTGNRWRGSKTPGSRPGTIVGDHRSRPLSRIYLVEDHGIVRDGLRAMLTGGGHEVVGEASDIAHALRELAQLRPDVVLLDLGLPGRSGLELLAALRRRAGPLRCLVLTMSTRPRDVAEAMQLGAAGYVLKDSSRADLLAAIDAVARGQRHFGPEVADLVVRALERGRQEEMLEELSARERQILTLVVRGESSTQIAARLGLSSKTVDTYRSRLMGKLRAPDVPALVRFAIRAGLIDVHDA